MVSLVPKTFRVGPPAPPTPSPYARITWRFVAIGSALIAVAALTTLVILTATTDADSLSSIALILAILAFIIQIIVFIADFGFNARRDKEAAELNASTQALLATIEEKANSTNQAVNGQMTKLLDNVLRGEKFKVKDEFSDDGEAEVKVRIIEEVRAQLLREGLSPQPSARTVPGSAPNTARRARMIREWPGEDLARRLAGEDLGKLSADAYLALAELGDDVLRSHDHEVPEGLTIDQLNKAPVDELREAKLVRETDELGQPAVVLTSKGIAAGRLVVATSPIPDYITELMPWLPEIRSDVSGRLD